MKSVSITKKSTCKELLHCLADLNKSDIKIYSILKQKGPSTVEDLSKKMQKNRSTIYRSLQKLMFSGICEKSPHILENGGYFHLYGCSNLQQLKETMKSCVDVWFHELEKHLEQAHNDG